VTNWDQRFLALAAHVASWSKDPSTKCGAVIVDSERRVVGIGYNGFPRHVIDRAYRYNDREEKLRYVVHAEANAILNAVGTTRGCTLYVHPLPCCNDCAKLVIQSGIDEVVSPFPTDAQRERWGTSWSYSDQMFAEAGIKVTYA
jgi:dCMP deaminase